MGLVQSKEALMKKLIALVGLIVLSVVLWTATASAAGSAEEGAQGARQGQASPHAQQRLRRLT